MQNDKLLNCPFCDKKLKRFKGGYEHKSSQCVLSSFILTDVEIPKWNTRKPMERIVAKIHDKFENFVDEIIDNPDHKDNIDFLLKQNKEICAIVRNGGKE